MEMQELRMFLENYKSGTFVTIVYEIPLNRLYNKRVVAQVMLGVRYKNTKGFKLKSYQSENLQVRSNNLPWGKWETDKYIIKHGENYYLRYYLFSTSLYKAQVVSKNGTYLHEFDNTNKKLYDYARTIKVEHIISLGLDKQSK